MNAVETIASRIPIAFPDMDPDTELVLRPLKVIDPSSSVGVFPVDWTPDLASMEIGQFGPTVHNYAVRIHQLFKMSDAAEGQAMASVSSKKLRVMLYADSDLRVALHQLKETTDNYTEQVLTFGVARQRFLNNELSGQAIFLSATDVWVKTQSTNIGGF